MYSLLFWYLLFRIFFPFLFSQSETKLETKEESHLEEEGPSMTQEKLSLP